MKCKDQLNRILDFKHTPRRIVSLVPSQTELLVDLGLEKNLVGITKFCVHPNHLKKTKTRVGGTKNIKLDIIKSLQPDIIICNKEENSKEIVTEVQAIAPTWVSDIYNLEDAIHLIYLLGELFKVKEKSMEIISKIISEKSIFDAFIKTKPQYNVAYIIWNNPYMIAGNNTFINHLLSLNNFINISANESSRYPEISVEELLKADKILLSSEPYPFNENHLEVIKKTTDKEVLLVDGEYFSWYGSRLTKAFAYFKTLH